MPTVTPEQIGGFVVVVAALIGLAVGVLTVFVLVKQLRGKTHDEEFITRKEFQESLKESTEQCSAENYALRLIVEELRKEIRELGFRIGTWGEDLREVQTILRERETAWREGRHET